jgi:hypothetical protein
MIICQRMSYTGQDLQPYTCSVQDDGDDDDDDDIMKDDCFIHSVVISFICIIACDCLLAPYSE